VFGTSIVRRGLLGAAALAVALTVPLTGGAASAGRTARPAASTPCLVPGVGKTIDQVWKPDFVNADGYTDTRTGDIAFAVRTDQKFYGFRPDHQEWSASIVKAMLMVAYLDQPSVAGRVLNDYDRSVLGPMITESDNDDAQIVFDTVGQGALQALANQVGMTNFATSPIWGETEITPRDQTKFFLHIDSYIAPLHQYYAMGLLGNIVPSERWGIGEVAPKGWQLYFKGGWGYGTGLIDSQVALLVRGCARISIAVLTMYDGSHDYGKETLRGIFSRLLRGLPTGAPKPRPKPRRVHHAAPSDGSSRTGGTSGGGTVVQ
jgi:Beta-lactamase enzyme family